VCERSDILEAWGNYLCQPLLVSSHTTSLRPFSSDCSPLGGIVLQEALQYHRGNRDKLVQLFDRVLQFYKELPVNFQRDLNSIFPDLERSFHQQRLELLTPECYILVAHHTQPVYVHFQVIVARCDDTS
jgi:hypothetical protein